MYTLIRSLPLRQVLAEQLPAAVGALVIAEAFYKWHSFTLEALGFLATWYALDFALQKLLRRRSA